MRHTIKKGYHDAKEKHFGVHSGTRSERYEVEFNNTNLYQPLDQEHDWNKLAGWSYGRHHKNSIRVGWRASGDFVEICLYLYENGNRAISEDTIFCPINSKVKLTLDYNNGMVTLIAGFLLDSYRETIKMPYSARPTIGYYLFPYFGGNFPAPQDMFINLKRLK